MIVKCPTTEMSRKKRKLTEGNHGGGKNLWLALRPIFNFSPAQDERCPKNAGPKEEEP